MAEETQSPQTNAELAACWNTVVPYDQVRTGPAFELGQYDFAVKSLTPGFDKNGLYNIVIELQCMAPSEIAVLPGKSSIFTRTLYIGSHKDPKAALPETRTNNPGDRFLKKIAEANKIPANAQSNSQLCAALVGKTFGVALVQGDDYTDKDGKVKKGGLEFGNIVTPAGIVPAKLTRTAATMQAAQVAAVAASAPAGATFN